MKTEYLTARFQDGTPARVVKTTEEMPGYPHLNKIPKYTLEDGEHLNPTDDPTVFKTIRTGRLVTISK